MSKILVVYYSLDGNTELAANQIKDITGADLEQLIPEHEPVRKGFRSLPQVVFRLSSTISPESRDFGITSKTTKRLSSPPLYGLVPVRRHWKPS